MGERGIGIFESDHGLVSVGVISATGSEGQNLGLGSHHLNDAACPSPRAEVRSHGV